MEEKIREGIDELDFNKDKCIEVFLKCFELICQNECNGVESDYILVNLHRLLEKRMNMSL